MLIGQRHENVIFVLLQMTDCFQVTYSTTGVEKIVEMYTIFWEQIDGRQII